MVLSDLKKNERAVVLKAECDGSVRERLTALGLCAGAKITLLSISPLRHTYLVQAGASKVALRREIAKRVLVWKI